MASKKTDCAIEFSKISKSFGNVHANKAIDLRIKKGCIHGIVGENGAGKSTLMSILYGFYQADSGVISVGGNEVEIQNSADAIALGIGMVHQHFMLVDRFTVLENVMLGAETGFLLHKSKKAARLELERLEKDFGLEVDMRATVGSLPVGLQQRVEILKALYRKANILVLDEPTAVLTPQETKHLFRVLKELKRQGKTILIITHKLQEIMALTDEVSVMRQGELCATLKTKETSESYLAELMVGRQVERQIPMPLLRRGDNLVEVKNLSVKDVRGHFAVKAVSFNLRAGEIVGIAGISGNGQSELLEALSGLRPIDGGKITIKGKHAITPEHMIYPRQMRGIGVAHVPEDRFKCAIIRDFSASDTAILGYHRHPKFCKKGVMQCSKIDAYTKSMMAHYDVRPQNPSLQMSLFSGGNQQKMVIGREVDHSPDVLLIGQPTRGVDIGAIEFIHQKIISLRDAGKAILMVSVELEEILTLSDRVLVMCQGELVGELSREEASEKTIGLMMAGIKREKVKG